MCIIMCACVPATHRVQQPAVHSWLTKIRKTNLYNKHFISCVQVTSQCIIFLLLVIVKCSIFVINNNQITYLQTEQVRTLVFFFLFELISIFQYFRGAVN